MVVCMWCVLWCVWLCCFFVCVYTWCCVVVWCRVWLCGVWHGLVSFFLSLSFFLSFSLSLSFSFFLFLSLSFSFFLFLSFSFFLFLSLFSLSLLSSLFLLLLLFSSLSSLLFSSLLFSSLPFMTTNTVQSTDMQSVDDRRELHARSIITSKSIFRTCRCCCQRRLLPPTLPPLLESVNKAANKVFSKKCFWRCLVGMVSGQDYDALTFVLARWKHPWQMISQWFVLRKRRELFITGIFPAKELFFITVVNKFKKIAAGKNYSHYSFIVIRKQKGGYCIFLSGMVASSREWSIVTRLRSVRVRSIVNCGLLSQMPAWSPSRPTYWNPTPGTICTLLDDPAFGTIVETLPGPPPHTIKSGIKSVEQKCWE